MKKLTASSLFLAAFLLIVIPGCQPDDPQTTTPTDDRDKFVASWTCQETSQQSGVTTFTLHINKSTTSSTQVLIENFYNIGFQYKATTDVSGSSLTIPSQAYNGNQLHGSGTMISNNTVNMTYYVDHGSGNIDTCTAVLTRQ